MTLIRPAIQALLPSLTRTPRELIAANGATSTIESLGTLVGPLLGVLVSVADVGLVFAVGAGVLLLGAASLLRVRVAGAVDLGAAEEGGSIVLRQGFEPLPRLPELDSWLR